jgi:hypothetical protein
MRQVEYSSTLCKNTYVYSPTRGGPTAFSVPLDSYLNDMGKQGWECCGSVPDKDGMTKIILKRYAPVVRRKSPTIPPNPESSLGVFSRHKDEARSKKLRPSIRPPTPGGPDC